MSLQSFVNIQEDIFGRLKRAQINYKKSPKERITKQYLESRLENVEQLWSQFSANHTQIIQNFEQKDLSLTSYCEKDVYFNVEELYLDLKCEIKIASCKFNNSDMAQMSHTSNENGNEFRNHNIKLPSIIIPKFSGNYTEWPTFRDLFLSAIHKNTGIDKVQKLHYLKSYLIGEAEQLLRHIPISDANYDRCWSQLEFRYNNKKYLSHCILRRLLSQRNIIGESAKALKELIDTTTDCLGGLNNLGIDTDSWDILIIHILTLKLDLDSRREWELRVTNDNESDQLPTFDQFKDFLTNRYRAFEFLETRASKGQSNISTRPNVFHVTSANCVFCNADHFIGNCKQFCKSDADTRRKFVQEKNLCFNCMNHGHSARQCKRTASCRICKRRHHSLLHSHGEQMYCKEESADSGNTREPPSTKSYAHTAGIEEETNIVSCLSKGSTGNQVLLATALVQAVSANGSMYTVRALLDQGSQASFVTEDIVQSLGLKKKAVKGIISGIGGEKGLISKALVEFNVKSRIEPSKNVSVKAYVLKSITSLLPLKKISYLDWVQVNNLQLADPTFHTPNRVDMLFGAEVYTKVLQDGLKRAPDGSLIAQCTTLGWILSGTVNSNNDSSNITVLHGLIKEDDMLRKFWEIEAEPNTMKKRVLTEEERKCEEMFKKTTTRDEDGRYVVHLPFKTDNPNSKYGDSKLIALKRFYALESKLNRNSDLKGSYTEVINEYLSLGHMKLLTYQEKLDTNAVYLPHHAVIKNDRDTTKVRVVFDASCKGSNGASLNSDLMVGATLQPELRHLLMKWRTHPICLVSDIVKMYRQVRVTDKHTNFQRILWRDNKDTEIKEYELLTVTFGTASAPFLAVRSMQQVVYDEGQHYPMAAERILKDYYVDDLMTGCQTIEEGLEIYKQINELLLKAGFELQKWSSNCNELLAKIESNSKDMSKDIKLKQDEVFKTLGLTWNRCSDTFKYAVHLPLSALTPVTKRKILSEVAKLFDPLGWVAPVVVIAKMLIQKLWIAGIGWDDVVSDDIKGNWNTYCQELQYLSEVSIPRWLNTCQGDQRVELHGFCDASKTAYAAVVYARVVDVNDELHVSLITAKTNVAPIKTVSIPRLELCGAVLLAKLLGEVAGIMNVDKSSIHAWTDSEIVLAWINDHPSRWKTFVANRVSEILCISEPQQWNHVQSKWNPADIASRGMYPSELLKSRLWFEGPSFLKNKNIEYKKLKRASITLEKVKVHLISEETSWIWDKYSSVTKLVRIIAYCRRVLEWKKPKSERIVEPYLKANELKLALECCVRECQRQTLQNEILILENKNCKKKSNLVSLSPYLDDVNILRVGGRLELSGLSVNQKHPMLLPSKSQLTNLLIADAHLRTLHGGPQLMLSYLGSKYYILGVKKLVKAYVRKCVTCIRYNAPSTHQVMGQLPTSRVTPSRPFRHSGVDYAGPISLRTSKGRGHRSHKGYICLFICMATKAIHLEVVSDLTTQGFLAAFKRFVARRGHCSDVWSDNGSNFQGASRELKLLLQAENANIRSDVAKALANEGTTWHFIPPHAPNFGGLWEAGVKSCKQHMRKVIGSTTLTYEELSTLLNQIEACLNSRPLCRLTDSNKTNALTPAHFLIGEPIINAPDFCYEDANVSSLKRWHMVQKMMQIFWRRWSNEYLITLLQRYKWSKVIPEPNIGDCVLIKEDNLPPCKWLLGRVTEKHPGLDNITRVVTLRANGSTFQRPTSKLCVLPIS